MNIRTFGRGGGHASEEAPNHCAACAESLLGRPSRGRCPRCGEIYPTRFAMAAVHSTRRERPTIETLAPLIARVLAPLFSSLVAIGCGVVLYEAMRKLSGN